jgi:hypothetical protein
MTENYGSFALSTFVFIIILLILICILPFILYIGTFFKKYSLKNDTSLLNNFIKTVIDIDYSCYAIYDMYLFCSYIPYRKLRICESGSPVEKNNEKLYLLNVCKIKDKITDLKFFCEGNYTEIKKRAEEAIVKNKENRINREHSENLVDMKESGKNKRAAWKNFLEWVKRISSWLHTFIEFIFRVWDYLRKFINIFIPVLQAIFSNQVITGYMVILITIYLLFYWIKSMIDPPKEEVEKEEGKEEDEGFLSSMYREYLDTLSYYNKLMKNVRIKDYTGGVSLGGAGNDGEEDDTILDRQTVDGKLYDNLSYLNMSELLSPAEQIAYFKTNVETGKYYNIYLPEEKFVNNNEPETETVIKWKVSAANNKNNNEKKWNIDCEAIDSVTVKNGDVYTDIPVFISNADKCIINETELNNNLFTSKNTDIKDTIYKTEYIK